MGIEFQKKDKVVFVMGATGTGKSRLSVDIANHVSGEIINSDKMQVYKELSIVTNKIPETEQKGVPHHLLGDIDDPESDFTVHDFCHRVMSTIRCIVKSGGVPVIAGGSNSFIEVLVENPLYNFKSKYDCCFLWLDVSLPILYGFVAKRVDQMVDAGLVDEVRSIFDPEADYGKGVRRSIGVPEMDEYFRTEMLDNTNDHFLNFLLEKSIEEIKKNTCALVRSQVKKIHRLRDELGWPIHRIDASSVFMKKGEEAEDAWEKFVLKPVLEIVCDFLKQFDV